MVVSFAELKADADIVNLLGARLTEFIANNADHVMFALDIDGTLTLPGAALSPCALEILNAIQAQTVFITAQAAEYVNKIGGDKFRNVVTEKGMMIKVKEKVTKLERAPAMVSGFTYAMEKHLATLNHPFVLNRKTAGYAVGFTQDVPSVEFASVLALMNKQVAANAAFVVEYTAGFVDLTLAHLSKARALRTVKSLFPSTHKWIACGDSANTDGPMLDAADKGIMVTNAYRSYPSVGTFEDMLAVLKWFGEVKAALDRIKRVID